jgi:hypothetical protein
MLGAHGVRDTGYRTLDAIDEMKASVLAETTHKHVQAFDVCLGLAQGFSNLVTVRANHDGANAPCFENSRALAHHSGHVFDVGIVLLCKSAPAAQADHLLPQFLTIHTQSREVEEIILHVVDCETVGRGEENAINAAVK